MIVLTDELKKKIEQHLKEKEYEDELKEINSYPVEKHTENILNESKKELQKLTEEQKQKILSVLDDFSSIYFVDESPDAEYTTEYDILMKRKEEEWKLHFLEDNIPSEIDALLKMCDEYEEEKKTPKIFGVEFGLIMNYDMWLNNSSVWPVMHNPEWKKWEKLKKRKIKRKESDKK